MLKRSLAPALLTILLLCPAAGADDRAARDVPVGTYRNPVGVDVADPHAVLHDGVYYLYGTSARDGFRAWSSTDLVNWEERGYVFQRTDAGWGRDLFWAPCVIERDGAFYLFYNARGPVEGDRQSHRICVARGDSPLGPFVDVAAPLFDSGKAVIDAHTFIDDDGTPYLYYVRDVSESGQSTVWVSRLSDDLLSLVGDPARCIQPSQDWEGTKWNEAPFVLKHGGTYILMYSAQGFYDPRYAIGYATAKSPMGPWAKAEENPILQQTEAVSGPGHNSVVPSPDGRELFAVYHVHKELKGGHPRELAIDRLRLIDEPGETVRVEIDGPTTEPQPLPSGVSQRELVPALAE